MKSDTNLLPAQQEACDQLLVKKYMLPGEKTVGDIHSRLSKGLGQDDEQVARFLETLRSGFVPGGRINRAIGANLVTTAINCFVQPIGDSMSGRDSAGVVGITDALRQSAETMRRGGGVGYDYSDIRPKGAKVKGTGSSASGALSYMYMFNSMCGTVQSAGERRGAQMGVLRIDHPDVEAFIDAKKLPGAEQLGMTEAEFAVHMAKLARGGKYAEAFRSANAKLQNFNISVAVTDAFMKAVIDDMDFDLVHVAEPTTGPLKTVVSETGQTLYVYRTVKARDLWDRIMRNTYNGAEPGVVFIDRVNAENNLAYCEKIAACNPCGEQFLPPYGACDLGSPVLARFVRNPFTPDATFDFEAFRKAVAGGVELLDRVLDVTTWPLPEQEVEARNKRRIGIGFTALAGAMAMQWIRYNSAEGVAFARRIAQEMRDSAYLASIELAKKLGPFPLFNADEYLKEGTFASRLPEHIKEGIRAHGIRNSHLLSIAPTGTITQAFADNMSSGIEPIFALKQGRRETLGDGSFVDKSLLDGAYRLFKLIHGEDAEHEVFVTAMDITVDDHLNIVEAVAPFIDSAISKTVNVPSDYSFDDFQHVYMRAWQRGLKGITTYRPNGQVGSVITDASLQPKDDVLVDDPDRRITLKNVKLLETALRWPNRPAAPQGLPAVIYRVNHPNGDFAVTVSHYQNGRKHPVEVYVSGTEQPRGLAAIAKMLSVDMRTGDAEWLKIKLDTLARTQADDAFDMVHPETGNLVRSASLVNGFAIHVEHALKSIGALDVPGESEMVNAMFTRKEPLTPSSGAVQWGCDIRNHVTGDKIHLTLKEAKFPDGSVRPYSVWLSGSYPKVLDGLCKVLSIDMHISDPMWAVMKLKKLLTFSEVRGDFMAAIPGVTKQQLYPSTIAYMAAVILERYRVLGLLKDDLSPALAQTSGSQAMKSPSEELGVGTGMYCDHCHTMSKHRIGGCTVCSHCGTSGDCG